MKFLLLVGLIIGVAWLLTRLLSSDTRQPREPEETEDVPDAQSEEMVACVHCGVHLPQGEAVGSTAGWFCSDAHRQAHGADPTDPV